MTREEFTGLYLGYLIKKLQVWLPEEAPEADFLNLMHKHLEDHFTAIKRVLVRNNNKNNRHKNDDTKR